MYSEAEAHLANLDYCGSRALRRAYLIILLAAERAGYHTGPKDKSRELKIRDKAGHQPFLLIVNQANLVLCVLRPAINDRPELGWQARSRFEDRVLADGLSSSEVRIRIDSVEDAEDVVDWVLASGGFSPGYGERRSA